MTATEQTANAAATGQFIASARGHNFPADVVDAARKCLVDTVGVGIGAVSGALGAAFSTNGPPVILHVAAHREWSADRQKATLVLFFLTASTITVFAHGYSGLVTGDVLRWFLWSTPLLFAGTLAGAWMYRRLGEHNYKRLTFGLILATGAMLILRALFTVGSF